ncbi:hypothetical protein HDV05_007232 [Chytridiales sp. JEL 0842]|nr:hypothetical protein HDV05_007232 [Chytridiales sp. JEL 0842]
MPPYTANTVVDCLDVIQLSSTPSSLPARRKSSLKPNSTNLWLRFLPEIRLRILDLSDALTQHLHDHGLYSAHQINKRPKHQRRKLYNDIWRTAFEREWHGDLSTLPGCYDPSEYDDENGWYTTVTTKYMWWKLLDLELKLETPLDDCMTTHIAMRHSWLDLLAPQTAYDPDMAIHLASTGGHLKYLIHLESIGVKVPEYAWTRLSWQVAREGRFEDINYLAQTRPQCFDINTTDFAAASGNLKLFQYLIEIINDPEDPFSYEAINNAAVNGRLEMVKYLSEYSFDCACSSRTMDYAASEGHLEVVRYLHENRMEGCTTNAMDWAAEEGHWEVVRFLNEHRKEGCTKDAMVGAASMGNLEVVRYLCQEGLGEATDELSEATTENGFVEVVEYLRELMGL